MKQSKDRLSLFDLVEDKRFADILSNGERLQILNNLALTNPSRTLKKLRKYYDIETFGRGQDLTIIVGKLKENSPFADGRSTAKTSQIVMDLLDNLQIQTAKQGYSIKQDHTNKQWLKLLGNIDLWTFNELRNKVKSKYKATNIGHTTYNELFIDLLPYNSPLKKDFSLVMTEINTLSTIDFQIDNLLKRLGGQLRSKSKKLGYKWEQQYMGQTLEHEIQIYDQDTGQFTTEIEPSKVKDLTDEQVKMYEDFLKKEQPKDMNIIEFSQTETCKSFLADKFNMKRIWQTWEIVDIPEPKNELQFKDTKDLRQEFLEYAYESFVTATFGAKLQRVPFKYARAINVAQFAHTDDYARQLLLDGEIDEIHSFDSNVWNYTDSLATNFYYKLLGDLTFVPAYQTIVKIMTGIELDPAPYIARQQAYNNYLLAQAKDDDLLQRALELCNPELFELEKA